VVVEVGVGVDEHDGLVGAEAAEAGLVGEELEDLAVVQVDEEGRRRLAEVDERVAGVHGEAADLVEVEVDHAIEGAGLDAFYDEPECINSLLRYWV